MSIVNENAAETAARLADIVESSDDAIIGMTLDGTIVEYNGGAERLYGYAAEELIGQSIEELVPPDCRDEFFESLERLRTRKLVDHFESKRICKDGRIIDVSVTIIPILNAQGRIVGASSIARDISDRKRLEKLQDLELQIAYIGAPGQLDAPRDKSLMVRQSGETSVELASFDDAMDLWAEQVRNVMGAHQCAVSYIPHGDYTRGKHAGSFSEKYAKYKTYDVKPTGQGIWRLVASERLSFCLTDAELKSHPAWKNFSDMRDARGLEHPPMRGWLAVPIQNPGHEFVGMLQLSDKYEGDFTEEDLQLLKRLTRLMVPAFTLRCALEAIQEHSTELTKAKDILERSNVELQQFAYIASHDLQTPLRAISGYAQFLHDDYCERLDEQADLYLQRIVRGVDRMQTLINNLLEYSSVESRALPFTQTDLNEALDEVLALLEASVRDTGAIVTRHNLPTVWGDRSQLVQLLQNLVSNAIKYHGDAPPQVHVSAEEGLEDWTIAVRDNGIGIDIKYHQRVFEIFRRLHTQERYPGTGIGLAVCHRIVLRHGGRIWVESIPDQGATFFFTIPHGESDES